MTQMLIQGTELSFQDPTFVIANDECLIEIEHAANEILETTGILLPGAVAARELWEEAGAEVVGEVVRVPNGLAREIISRFAKPTFVQEAINPEFSIRFGQGSLIVAPTTSAPYVQEGMTRRDGSTAEYIHWLSMIEEAPAIRHAGGLPCDLSDIKAEARHLEQVALAFQHSSKPLLGPIPSSQSYLDALELAEIAFDTADLGDRCVFLNSVNPDSPLRYAEDVIDALITSSIKGQGTLVTSYLMLGLTAPASVSGALSQGLAEVMFGLATAFLANPKAKVMGGILGIPFSMRSMRPDFGAPQSWMLANIAAQLMRRLGVPCRGDGCVTSSKCLDWQAAIEGTYSALWSQLSKMDFILHGVGWLDNGLASSKQKLSADLASYGGLPMTPEKQRHKSACRMAAYQISAMREIVARRALERSPSNPD